MMFVMKVRFWLLVFFMFTPMATVMVYDALPATLPFHWGADGLPDSYHDRIFVYATALLPLVLYGLMFVIPLIDPRRDSYIRHARVYEIVVVVILFFLTATHWLVVAYGLGFHPDIPLLSGLGVAILLIVIGRYLPKIEHNYTFGIRTPWTLADENVWKETHAAAGLLFVFVGLVWIAAMLLLDSGTAYFVMIGLLVIVVAGLFLYSWILFNNKKL